MQKIRAIVFDFDGLILDTETPELQALQELYRQYNCELPMDLWADCIGRPHGHFDPYDYLATTSGQPLDREAVRTQRKARMRELIEAQDAMPGVREYLRDAKGLGLSVAIASSSSTQWVTGHLRRLGLDSAFASFACREQTTSHKPDPAPYLCAVEALGVKPQEAIGLEDSPNGVTSAKAAGLFAVGVPNPVTGLLDLSHADMVVRSLAEMPLRKLLEHVEHLGREC